MKKNYFSPAIETTVLGYSLMNTNDPSANKSITDDTTLGSGDFAPKRARPF